MNEAMMRKARQMLTRDEGLKRLAYDDKTGLTVKKLPSGGRITCGIGRNISDVPLSDAVIYLMLVEDLMEAERVCVKTFGTALWNSWGDHRKLGFLNMAFNLGEGGLSTFVNTLKFAKLEDWKNVEKNLKDSLYYRQVGSRAERVIAMICKEEFPYA